MTTRSSTRIVERVVLDERHEGYEFEIVPLCFSSGKSTVSLWIVSDLPLKTHIQDYKIRSPYSRVEYLGPFEIESHGQLRYAVYLTGESGRPLERFDSEIPSRWFDYHSTLYQEIKYLDVPIYVRPDNNLAPKFYLAQRRLADDIGKLVEVGRLHSVGYRVARGRYRGNLIDSKNRVRSSRLLHDELGTIYQINLNHYTIEPVLVRSGPFPSSKLDIMAREPLGLQLRHRIRDAYEQIIHANVDEIHEKLKSLVREDLEEDSEYRLRKMVPPFGRPYNYNLSSVVRESKLVTQLDAGDSSTLNATNHNLVRVSPNRPRGESEAPEGWIKYVNHVLRESKITQGDLYTLVPHSHPSPVDTSAYLCSVLSFTEDGQVYVYGNLKEWDQKTQHIHKMPNGTRPVQIIAVFDFLPNPYRRDKIDEDRNNLGSAYPHRVPVNIPLFLFTPEAASNRHADLGLEDNFRVVVRKDYNPSREELERVLQCWSYYGNIQRLIVREIKGEDRAFIEELCSYIPAYKRTFFPAASSEVSLDLPELGGRITWTPLLDCDSKNNELKRLTV